MACRWPGDEGRSMHAGGRTQGPHGRRVQGQRRPHRALWLALSEAIVPEALSLVVCWLRGARLILWLVSLRFLYGLGSWTGLLATSVTSSEDMLASRLM